MIQNNAKSLFDNTVILHKQTTSSRHDVCLDQRSFKCKIGENCSNIYLYRDTIQILSSLLSFGRFCIGIPLGVCLSCFESNDSPSFPWSNIHNRHVKYITV